MDLVIPEGDFVFLVGPSGAGKSTLIKLLIRDEVATRGEVVLDGQDLARLPRRQVPQMRRKIGIIFQDYKLLPTKSVWENVAFALEVTGTPARDQAGGGPRALPRRATARPRQLPDQLSGGEQQRRPSPGPRPRPETHHRRRADRQPRPLIGWGILQLLLRINEMGVTVLMATHDADVVTALRKRVVALEEGRVIVTRSAAPATARTDADVISFLAFSLTRAWQGFWRNAVMSLAATATMMLMFLLLSWFWIIQAGLLAGLGFIEEKVGVVADLRTNIGDSQLDDLRAKPGALPEVRRSSTSAKEEALERLPRDARRPGRGGPDPLPRHATRCTPASRSSCADPHGVSAPWPRPCATSRSSATSSTSRTSSTAS